MSEPCIQQEKIGRFEEFIENTKGMRTAIAGIIVAIIIQVMAFLFMWGGLVNTVNRNTEYLWKDLSVSTRENTRNLDRLMTKLEGIKFIALPEVKAEQPIK